MYEKLSLGTRISENIKNLGLELTTLFELFDIALGPTNGMSRKILLYTHVRRQKILLRKLLYTLIHDNNNPATLYAPSLMHFAPPSSLQRAAVDYPLPASSP